MRFLRRWVWSWLKIEDWNCCGAAATHSLNHLLVSLSCQPEISRRLRSAQAGPLVIPCAGCFNMTKRAEHVLETTKRSGKRSRTSSGLPIDPSFEMMALMDVVVNRIGLERFGERSRPLSGD